MTLSATAKEPLLKNKLKKFLKNHYSKQKEFVKNHYSKTKKCSRKEIIVASLMHN